MVVSLLYTLGVLRFGVFLIGLFVGVLPSFGQSDGALQCKSFSITGPAGIPEPNQPESFTLAIENPEEYKFVWTVTGGKIVGGQGTTKLVALRRGRVERLIAAVEIIGLPAGCPTTGSETALLIIDPGAILVAEVPILASKLPKSSLDRLIDKLRKNPNAQGYVVFETVPKTTAGVVSNYQRKIETYIASQARRIDSRRITIIRSAESSANRLRLYLVPPGATPPSQD
jgi:hypothetical protein